MAILIYVSLIAVSCFVLGIVAAYYAFKHFLFEVTQHAIDETMSYRDFLEEQNSKVTVEKH